ncbi:MAG: LacI family DNA-binding transcriptional regulator [Anaerococcus sp.]|nr:LacI family DNA-binding transcriptional regulator [Anaerococcus sp.]
MTTMKEVAKEAKVSLGSVSNVINNKPVRPETKRKVEAAIEKLNYEKNDLASGFKTNRTKTIGLIIPTVWHPFFSQIAFYVEKYLLEDGYKLLLCNSNGNAGSELQYIQLLRQNMIDGIIAITYSDIEMYINSKLPFVSIDRIFSTNVNFVASKNYEGGRLAGKTLVDKGSKNLIFIGSHNKFVNATMDRRKGFVSFCKENNINYEVIDLLEPYQGLDLEIKKAFAKNPKIDGIFALNDFLGLDIIKILEEIDRYPIRDYQIIGFDGIKLSFERDYVISTIAQPISGIARKSVEILLKNIEDENHKENAYLPVDFKDGGTTW